jgi:hypothetical protein
MTDHTDIVERLMALAERMAYVYASEHTHATVPAAAEHAALQSALTAEITRLRAEAEALRKALAEERDQCAITVWMTQQEATADDADDKGLDGWMREAERRIRDRAIDATKGTT